MKLSSETFSILKNFSTINKGILLTPGSNLESRTKAIFAQATIKEDFPLEVGIYDLAGFLGIVSLFGPDAEFDFKAEYLRIAEQDGKSEMTYYYAGAGLVGLTSKRKKLEIPSQTIDFVLTEEQWSKVQKAASVLQKPELKITSDGKVVRIHTENHKQPSSNVFSAVMEAEPHGNKCKMVFDLNNMKIMKGSYSVTITEHYTKFKNTSGYDLTYLIGAEPTTSTFGTGE
jgi:hypothetical protein